MSESERLKEAQRWLRYANADARLAVVQARSVWESMCSDLARRGFDVEDGA